MSSIWKLLNLKVIVFNGNLISDEESKEVDEWMEIPLKRKICLNLLLLRSVQENICFYPGVPIRKLPYELCRMVKDFLC
jgi:hypothetical protein